MRLLLAVIILQQTYTDDTIFMVYSEGKLSELLGSVVNEKDKKELLIVKRENIWSLEKEKLQAVN